MATNFGTTLWLNGYYYVPNRIEGKVTTKVGQWYSYLPPSDDSNQATGIDFSTLPAPNDKPAAKVAIVVGYLNTCFNILEFFHARLQASPTGNQLSASMSSRPKGSTIFQLKIFIDPNERSRCLYFSPSGGSLL